MRNELQHLKSATVQCTPCGTTITAPMPPYMHLHIMKYSNFMLHRGSGKTRKSARHKQTTPASHSSSAPNVRKLFTSIAPAPSDLCNTGGKKAALELAQRHGHVSYHAAYENMAEVTYGLKKCQKWTCKHALPSAIHEHPIMRPYNAFRQEHARRLLEIAEITLHTLNCSQEHACRLMGIADIAEITLETLKISQAHDCRLLDITEIAEITLNTWSARTKE